MNGPRDWGWPEWLLLALAVAVGLAGVAGANTGAEAYGTFNPSWDGGSELRATVADAGTEPYVLLDRGDYDALDPDETVIVVLSPVDPYDDADREEGLEWLRGEMEVPGIGPGSTSDPQAGAQETEE